MKNVMVDLETLGTTPGCVILSIGAVYFDAHGMGEEFYKVINKESCIAAGLHTDEATLEWWTKQSQEAAQVLREAEMPFIAKLESVLLEFNDFLKKDTGIKVWGNGADFDNSILAAAYRAASVKQGWLPYNGRCYRTLKNIAPIVPKLERSGTHHNALDDAKSQASHTIHIYHENPYLIWK